MTASVSFVFTFLVVKSISDLIKLVGVILFWACCILDRMFRQFVVSIWKGFFFFVACVEKADY